MASPAAVLSILVSADTRQATSALTRYDAQLEKSNEIAKKGIETRLGATFDPKAFDAYSTRTDEIARKAQTRAAFKQELGASYSNAGFNAYWRDLKRNEKATADLEEHSRGLRGQLSETGHAASKTGGMFSGLAKSALGLVGAYGAYAGVKDAISSTVALGESTEKLSAITGADTKTASTWINVMAARGLSTKSASMAFITLEKNIRNAGMGSKTATEAFTQLGITQQELKTTDPTQMVALIANGLQQIQDPAQRAALAQQLFSRGAQAMIPVLAQGSKGLNETLRSVQAYGDYLPNTSKSMMGAVQAGRQLQYAMGGLKIAFTSAVLPALIRVINGVLGFIRQMRSGQGAGGVFVRAIKSIASVLSNLWTFIKQNSTEFLALAGAITAVVVTFKAMQIVSTIVTFVRNLAIATGILTATEAEAAAAQKALNLAFLASPIGLVVVAIAGLVAALVVLYLKVKVVHNFINAAWKDILTVAKAVWPTIQTIITDVWKFISTYAVMVWNGITTYLGGIFKVIQGLVEIFTGLFTLNFSKMWKGVLDLFTGAGQAILGWFKLLTAPLRAAAETTFDVIRDVVVGVLNWVIGKLNWVVGKVNDVAGPISDVLGINLRIGTIGKITLPGATRRAAGAADILAAEGITPPHAARHAAARARREGHAADATKALTAGTQHVIQWATAAHKTSKSLTAAEKTAERIAKIEERTAKSKEKAAERIAKTEAKARERVAKLHEEGIKAQIKAARQAAAKADKPLTAAEKRRLIPSLAVAQQIRMAQLKGQAASAKSTGDIGAEANAIEAERALERQWLAADQAKLQKINQQLAKRGLSHTARATLLQDKLALLQEMATIQAKIGTLGGNLSSLAKGGTSGTLGGNAAGGQFNLAPTGGPSTLPTFLDVMKSAQGATGMNPAHVTHNNQHITIHVHRETDVKKVADVIDKATRSHVHAKLRNAGLRGT